jgi:Flp pilus assembly protein TadD
MPERRTQDVIHVVMTDHRIQRRPAPEEERLAPLEPKEPEITALQFLTPETAPQGAEGEVYRAVTALRALPGAKDALAHLQKSLASTSLGPVPTFDLARGLLQQKRFAEAETTVSALLTRWPKDPLALQWTGVARFGQGDFRGAERAFREELKHDPDNPEGMLNLGLVLLAQERHPAAIRSLREALSLRPELAVGWLHLGNALAAQDEGKDAVTAYVHALAIEPSFTRAYLALGKELLRQGDGKGARRYLAHGARVAQSPDEVAKALAELGPAEP